MLILLLLNYLDLIGVSISTLLIPILINKFKIGKGLEKKVI